MAQYNAEESSQKFRKEVSMMHTFILLILLSATHVDVLSQQNVYSDPLAFNRAPESGISIDTSKYKGKQLTYLQASIGKDLPIITATTRFANMTELHTQISMAACTWITLGYKDWVFPLLTQDFLVRTRLSLKYGHFSTTLSYNHISAHLGDGMEMLLESSLSKNDKQRLHTYQDLAKSMGVNIDLAAPFAYSRDFITTQGAYEREDRWFQSKFYARFGAAWKIIPEMKPYFFGLGFEETLLSRPSPYLAFDMSYDADVNRLSLSGQLGVYIWNDKESGTSIRMALTAYHGKDLRGQLLGEELNQFGIGVFVR